MSSISFTTFEYFIVLDSNFDLKYLFLDLNLVPVVENSFQRQNVA